MVQLQKREKIVLIAGIIVSIAVAAYFAPVYSSVAINPIADQKPSGKIGSDVFEAEKNQAIDAARKFILQSPTFAYDGMFDTLKIRYVSVMESYPVQYNIEATYTSAHGGFGDRSDQIVTQVLTPHKVELIVTEGKITSAVTDKTWDELHQQYVQREADSDIPMNLPGVHDYASFIDALEKMNLSAEVVEVLEDSSFSVPTIVVSVNGQHVQVFEFSSATDTEEATLMISDDGTQIGTSVIRWIDVPHFYTQGKIIVLYVGHDQTTLDLLESLLDKQFAGM